MFEVCKTFEISGSHKLELNYESKCRNLHGHNWKITVKCTHNQLDENGMVYDFSLIENKIKGLLDHKDITGLIEIDGERVNSTAENIALFIAKEIGKRCSEVRVEESDGNVATWRF